MPIKSFRGLIADGSQATVFLHTNNGSTGYRITKFEVMPTEPGVSTSENVVKIYKTEQAAVTGTIDFEDNRLLGAAYYQSESSSYSDWKQIVFDNEIFNQDIFITNKDNRANSTGMNYYIELEQISLNVNENTVATLKDIRNQ